MIDVFNVIDGSPLSQIFYTKGSTDWQIWQKPNNAKMVSIFCLGGGAGGGSGQDGAGSTTRRGGGGGGSSAYSYSFYNGNSIPDVLYLLVGEGGAGGAGGTGGTGGTGGISYVSCEPNTTEINLLIQSGNAAPVGGGDGSIAGAAGAAGTVWDGTGIISDASFSTKVAGQTGATGTTAGTPTAITIGGRITTSGAGGAGYSSGVNIGGSITGSEFVPTISGGTGSINSAGEDGSGGFTSLASNILLPTRNPMFFTGGGGGGCSNNATGGNGGNGSFGSGGGGGGVGVSNKGGAGGKGGDGLIIITCY